MKRAAYFVARTLIVLAVVLPFVPMVLWSFSGRWAFPDLLPTEWSLRAWEIVVKPSTRTSMALRNSTLVATIVTLISIGIGIPAGRALGLYKFKGKSFVEFLVLSPTIVPTLAVAMGIHVAFIRYGLADTLLGVVLVHLIPVTPYMVLIMASTFANYNPEFEQQARSLGAGSWQIVRHVMLPTIFPGLLVGSLFAFIISWSQYILTLLIGGGSVFTMPMLLFAFASGSDRSVTAALALVFIAPTLVFLIVTSRYLGGGKTTLGGFGQM